MSYRISVDTGGTFTDVVVSDEAGRLELGKAPTTRTRAYEGLREGVGQVAERLGLTVEELLAQTEVLTYGTTRATNAIVEGQDRAHGVLHDRGLPGHPAGARGWQARPVQADPVSAPVRPALAHVRDPRAHGPDGEPYLALDEASVVAAIDRRASCESRRSRSACSGRSSTRRTRSASAS